MSAPFTENSGAIAQAPIVAHPLPIGSHFMFPGPTWLAVIKQLLPFPATETVIGAGSAPAAGIVHFVKSKKKGGMKGERVNDWLIGCGGNRSDAVPY